MAAGGGVRPSVASASMSAALRATGTGAGPANVLTGGTPAGGVDAWDVLGVDGGGFDVDLTMETTAGLPPTTVARGDGGNVSACTPPSVVACATPLIAPRPEAAAASSVTPASVMSDVYRIPAVGGPGGATAALATTSGGRGGTVSTSTVATDVDGGGGGAACGRSGDPPPAKRKITRKRPRKSEAAAEAARWAPAIASQDLAGTTAAASRRMTTEERQLMLHKRKLRNRASAARSRAVARTVVADVVGDVAALEEAVSSVGARVEGVVTANTALRRENEALRLMVNSLQRTVQLQAQGGGGVSVGLVGPPSLRSDVKVEQPVDGKAAMVATGSVPMEPFPSAQAVTVVASPPTKVARVPPSQMTASLWVPRPATTADRAADHSSGGRQSQLISASCPPLTPLVVGCTPSVAYPDVESRYAPPPPQVQQPLPPAPPPPPPPPPRTTAAPLPLTTPVATGPATASPDASQTYEDDALLPPQLLEQLALSVDQAPPEVSPAAAADLNASAEAPGGSALASAASAVAPATSAVAPAASAEALAVDAKHETTSAATPDADAGGVLPPGLPFSPSNASLETLFASLADGGPPPFSLPRTASMLRLYTWTA